MLETGGWSRQKRAALRVRKKELTLRVMQVAVLKDPPP